MPILTYAEVVLDIDELDIREFFSATNSEQCYINQLGLVAGKPVQISGKTKEEVYDELISAINEYKANL